MRARIYRSEQSTNLKWESTQERDIDVLTAMGISDTYGVMEQLGGLLLSVKGANKSRGTHYFPGHERYKADLKDAIRLLVRIANRHRAMPKLRMRQWQPLAGMAIAEWLNDSCAVCNGAAQVKNEAGTVIIECQACNGSGKHRFTDEDRARVMGERMDKPLSILHGLIGIAERLKVQAVGRLLERW